MSQLSNKEDVDLFMKFCRNSIIEYIGVFLGSIIYAILYEFLGKGVYSIYNRLLWIVPLIFGIPVFLIVAFVHYKAKSKIDRRNMIPKILTVYKITIDLVCARMILMGIGEVYGSPITKAVIFDYLVLIGIIVVFFLSIVMVVKNKQKNGDDKKIYNYH